ncbi:MAG: hypothetical protein AAF664_08500 [Planctomycetota bacterium]
MSLSPSQRIAKKPEVVGGAIGPWLIILAACLFAMAWAWPASIDKRSSPVVDQDVKELSTVEPEDDLSFQRAQFFDEHVLPAVRKCDHENHLAVERCVVRIEQMLDGYRAGIPSFCREVNSWKTRFGVLKRMPGDWWREDNQVESFIEDKFAKHLFTDARLRRDLDSILLSFRHDVLANQSQMLVSIRAATEQEHLPGLDAMGLETFGTDLKEAISRYAADAAKDSVVSGVLTEIAAGGAGLVIEQLLVQVLARLSTVAATTATAAGGATAGGAAAGGTGGSVGGPIGAAAGIGVGLAVGVAIDWWMSSKFEAKMTSELNQIVDGLHAQLLSGDEQNPGLPIALNQSCDELWGLYRDVLFDQIVAAEVLP